MRLDHLLSRESDILTRLDLDEMDRENEFQDCSILKVLPLEQLCCEIAKRCGNGRSEERVRSLIRAAEQAAMNRGSRSPCEQSARNLQSIRASLPKCASMGV